MPTKTEKPKTEVKDKKNGTQPGVHRAQNGTVRQYPEEEVPSKVRYIKNLIKVPF